MKKPKRVVLGEGIADIFGRTITLSRRDGYARNLWRRELVHDNRIRLIAEILPPRLASKKKGGK